MASARVLAIASAAVSLLMLPSTAAAQTCADYSEVMPNGKPSQVFTSASTSDHISFFFWAIAGRSYSVEIHNVSRNYLAGTISMNVNTTNCPTTNMAGVNDTRAIEPTPITDGARFVRYSFTAPSPTGFVQFRGGAASGTASIQATATDTTLYSNWFFISGDYGAYTLLRNTTATPLNFTINWRDAAGSIVGTFSGTLAANGSTFVNGRDYVTGVTSGTVEIVHNSTPGAIEASTTVLSSTTGLSFDAPFTTRRQ